MSRDWEELDEVQRQNCIVAIFGKLHMEGDRSIAINGMPTSTEAVAALCDLAQRHDRYRHEGGELIVLRKAAKRADEFREELCESLRISADSDEDYKILQRVRELTEGDERS